jgi:hypothetical protein
MSNMVIKQRNIQRLLLRVFAMFTLSFILMTPFVSAEKASAPGVCNHKQKNIGSLIKVTDNYPIIPVGCATNEDGSPRPLSPEVLPEVAINGYYFLVSLGFTLIGPLIAITGFLYYQAGLSGQDTKTSLVWLQNAGVSLIILVFASVVPVTITQIFDIGGSTDLGSYFTFK